MSSDAESYLKSGSNELRVLEYRVAGQTFGINILKVNKIINNLNELMSVPESLIGMSLNGIRISLGSVRKSLLFLLATRLMLRTERSRLDRSHSTVRGISSTTMSLLRAITNMKSLSYGY